MEERRDWELRLGLLHCIVETSYTVTCTGSVEPSATWSRGASADTAVHAHWQKNVLIVPNPWGIPSNQVRPLLCDFGMARLQHASNQNSLTMFPLISLKAEFTAPEVIDWAGKEVRPTKAGDVFSFAKTMLAFALLSDPKKGPIEGEGNGFPPRLWAFGYTQTPDLWRLMKDMTQKDPEKRPKMVKEFGNADGEDGVALVETRMRNEVLWENPYYRLPAQP